MSQYEFVFHGLFPTKTYKAAFVARFIIRTMVLEYIFISDCTVNPKKKPRSSNKG